MRDEQEHIESWERLKRNTREELENEAWRIYRWGGGGGGGAVRKDIEEKKKEKGRIGG